MLVLGDGRGKSAQRDREGDWGDRGEISRMDLAQIVVQSPLHECVIKNMARKERREVKLQNLELSLVNGSGPPSTPEFSKDKFSEVCSIEVF